MKCRSAIAFAQHGRQTDTSYLLQCCKAGRRIGERVMNVCSVTKKFQQSCSLSEEVSGEPGEVQCVTQTSDRNACSSAQRTGTAAGSTFPFCFPSSPPLAFPANWRHSPAADGTSSFCLSLSSRTYLSPHRADLDPDVCFEKMPAVFESTFMFFLFAPRITIAIHLIDSASPFLCVSLGHG